MGVPPADRPRPSLRMARGALRVARHVVGAGYGFVADEVATGWRDRAPAGGSFVDVPCAGTTVHALGSTAAATRRLAALSRVPVVGHTDAEPGLTACLAPTH